MKNKFKLIGVVLVMVLFYLGYTTYPKLDLITGFSAKSMASCYFITQRSQKVIEHNDNNIPQVNWSNNKIDNVHKIAYSSIFGLKERKAIYREGIGATLITDDFDISKPYRVPNRKIKKNNLFFPYGGVEPKDTLFANIDYLKLKTAVANAFDKNNERIKNTRAVLVIYKDKIIAEKYATGIDKNTKLLGWSMTKSLTATLFGVLQKQNKININSQAPIDEWANDDRSKITINDLIHMNSGLEWEEDYTKICDVTKMLFLSKDMTQSQINKPLVGKPNSSWNYSSGTSNLLSGILRKQFKTHQEYLDFWYSDLIDKIGMHSMLVETDMAGNYVGSSYSWATTRDWAKFGLLYLHKGNWNGEQIFDEKWCSYVATPTNGSKGNYGWHFWLNSGGYLPNAPKDVYSANGYQGQRVFILPSQEMVIVRLGLSEEKSFDFNGLLKSILSSVKH